MTKIKINNYVILSLSLYHTRLQDNTYSHVKSG